MTNAKTAIDAAEASRVPYWLFKYKLFVIVWNSFCYDSFKNIQIWRLYSALRGVYGCVK